MGANFHRSVPEHRLATTCCTRGAKEFYGVFRADVSRFWLRVCRQLLWVEPTINRRCWGRIRHIMEDAADNASPKSNGAQDRVVSSALGSCFVFLV